MRGMVEIVGRWATGLTADDADVRRGFLVTGRCATRVNRIPKGGSCPIGISASMPQGGVTQGFYGALRDGGTQRIRDAETTAIT